MKKYLIIAAAAIAAVACTKSESKSPDIAISFQVANYVPQTKAGEVKFDENETFTTYAWFHENASASAQEFMEDETIKWQSATNTWAADRTYFWPKTGWVNFFSFAGTPEPAMTEGQAAYSAKTIATDDNALLASAAYRYSQNVNVYDLEYGTSNTDVNGVPTLFHHILSKITVNVKFDASGVNGTDAAKYKWDLVIDEAALIYANKGSLSVSFTDPGSTGQAWPYNTPAVGWVPTSGAANVSEATTVTGASSKITTVAPNVSDPETLLSEITVMPQNITVATGTSAKFAVKFTLTEYYDNVEGIHYTVDLTGDNAIAIEDFSTTVKEWDMNYKYTYTLTVKPNKTVTFDPAIEPWATDSTPAYVYPNS